MKRFLLPLLLAGIAGLPAHRALAQEKPVLNTAPPPPPPAPARPAPVEPQAQPQPSAPQPQPQPTPDSPSGLNFPNRGGGQNGGAADQPPAAKKFLYTNFGLGYASSGGLNRFNVSAAPAVGFRLTNKFAVGPGISYAYSSFSLSGNNNSNAALNRKGDKSINSSSLGLKAFAQYIVYKEFFVHAEYEVTNAELIDYDQNNGYFKYRRTVSTPLAGIGYRSYLGQHAAADIVALYNFDNTVYSLYPGLVVRFSFLFDLGR